MKLYDATTPNTLRVHVFMAEKGIDLPRQPIDVLAGGTRTRDFLSINSLGELPVLELDDGTIITESVAICRYLERLHPTPALFGESAIEQARIEMWSRRIELYLFDAVAGMARHRFPFFADKVEQIAAYADSQERRFDQLWSWLDGELADGRPFLAGERFSVADITGMAMLFVCTIANKALPSNTPHANAWAERLRSRESFSARLPQAA